MGKSCGLGVGCRGELSPGDLRTTRNVGPWGTMPTSFQRME